MPSRTLALTTTLAAAALLAGGATQSVAAVKGPPDPIADEAAFFRKNAQAKTVVTLPGLQYMVLQSGPADGARPTRTDDVTVRYEGRFLNGQVFNTSPRGGLDAVTYQLNKLIPGWVAALQMMRPGDVWMLYVPSNLAYGAEGKSYIPPYSTLVFRVELVSVAPHVDPAPPPPPAPVVIIPEPPPPPPPPLAAAKPVHHHHKPAPKPEPKPEQQPAEGASGSEGAGKS